MMKNNTKEIRKYERIYKKQELDFEHEQETQLERRKKALSEIRDLHKPLDHADLETFSRHMAEISH